MKKKRISPSSLVVVIALFSIILGLYRLIFLQKTTLPTIRLLELGIFSLTLYILYKIRDFSKIFYKKFIISKKFTLIASIIIGYVHCAYWAIVSPQPTSIDIPRYSQWTQELAAHLFDPIFLKSFFTSHLLEPLPLLLFATLYRLGLPFEAITTVVVPSFIASSVFVFYKLSKEFVDEREAVMGALIFAVSPLHLKLALDVLRHTIGYFFALITLYFACTEKRRIPWKTTTFLLLTALSHAVPAVTLILTAITFAIITWKKWEPLKRSEQEIVRNNLLKTIAIYFVCAPIIAPYTYWPLWIEMRYYKKLHSYLEKPLLLMHPEAFHLRLLTTTWLFEWCFSIAVVGFLGFYTALKNKELEPLPTSLLLSVLTTILFALLFPFFLWNQPDRWGLMIDIPLTFFTIYYISNRFNDSAMKAVLIVMIWTLIDSISYVFAYVLPKT